MDAITCIHATAGLCPKCQADYDADPLAYLEYGDHPAGIANWRALQEEMAANLSRPVLPQDDSMPF